MLCTCDLATNDQTPETMTEWRPAPLPSCHCLFTATLKRAEGAAYPLCQLSFSELCSCQHVPGLGFPGFMVLWRLHVLGFHPFLTFLQAEACSVRHAVKLQHIGVLKQTLQCSAVPPDSLHMQTVHPAPHLCRQALWHHTSVVKGIQHSWLHFYLLW